MALISSAIVAKIGVRNSLVIGASCQFVFIFSQIFPSWKEDFPAEKSHTKAKEVALFFQSDGFIRAFSIIASIVAGFGSSIIWVAQGQYLSKCATAETKGLYFGMFWSVYSLSQVLGNLFGAIVFENQLTKTELHLIMTGVALLGVFSFFFTRRPFIHRTVAPRRSFKLSNERDYYTDYDEA